ncbi:hypothetical protein D9M71_756100 [compost metagenome]
MPRGHAKRHRLTCARLSATVREGPVLNLDHFGAHVGKKATGLGTRHDYTQVENK